MDTIERRLLTNNRSLMGPALRDEGMARATEHAERVIPGWRTSALEWVMEIARHHGYLTSETVMDAAYARGLSPPPEPRAWGTVMTGAARAGWIVRDGYETSKHPQAHCRPITRWRSLLR